MFLDAILAYEIPSRVRGDHGGENRDVAILMVLLCGLHCTSYMLGSSMSGDTLDLALSEVPPLLVLPEPLELARPSLFSYVHSSYTPYHFRTSGTLEPIMTLSYLTHLMSISIRKNTFTLRDSQDDSGVSWDA